MMNSLYSAVSGLQSHRVQMDVIGNNISNINTVGFKYGTASFSEIFSQTLGSATAPNTINGIGGTNPMQLGLGVGVSSINTIMTQGSLQLTGNPTDLAISGEGFFIVSNGNTGSYMFTRAGNFGIDQYGNLVTADGDLVCGYMNYDGSSQVDGSFLFDTEQSVEPINIFYDKYNNNKTMIAPQATENAVFTGNLNAQEECSGVNINDIGTTPGPGNQDFSTPMTVYDELGNEYEVDINFTKCFVDESDSKNPVTSWYWEVSSQDGTTSASGYIAFDKQGQIIKENSSFETSNQVVITPDASSTGTGSFTVTVDFEGLTMYSYDSAVNAYSVDGYSSGELLDFSIGSDGIIMGIYNNGQQQPLGMIALAGFSNPAGLEKVGNNLYVSTANSGSFNTGCIPGTAGVGSLSVGTLEMSNVDLAREFNNMIITQKGFQANSKIITTVDEMLQELINLKR